MNIHHLELFHHVAEAGGITPALPRIPYGIRQPAVSSQIRKLEADLGLKLFQRRPFALTREGEALAAFARPFFNGLAGIEQHLRSANEQRLRIAAQGVILREYLPTVLQSFRDAHPDLQLELQETDQTAAEALLGSQQVDLALTVLAARPSPALNHEVLVDVEPILIVPKSSKFRKVEDLWKQKAKLPPLISFEEREPAVKHFRKFLAHQGITWETQLRVNSVDLVRTYCAQGFGIGLIARLPKAPAPEGFRYLPLKPIKPFNIAAIWTLTPTRITQRFIKALRAQAASLRGR